MLNTHNFCKHILSGLYFISCKLMGFAKQQRVVVNQGDWHVSVYKIPKSNRSFIRLLLGKCSSVTARDKGPLFYSSQSFAVTITEATWH